MAWPVRAYSVGVKIGSTYPAQTSFRITSTRSGSSGQNNPRTPFKPYRPGDSVRQSGIYEVVHHREHRPSHEVVMISGETFPDCDQCKDRVRFRLVRTAPYIFQDEDFEDNPR